MSDRILIAEDNKNLCRILESALSEAGYEVVVALGGDAAVHEIKAHPFDLVISDMRMPGASGSVVFQEARAQSYQPDVILMTAFGDTREAVRLMRDGAADYILKDFDPEELVTRVGQVLERRRLKQESSVLKGRIETLKEQISLHHFDMIVGQSRAMRDAIGLAERVARTDANVLLLGESGTGKELFGHERGAFTGAIRTKPGRFEFAEGGTVFLDEIGEVPQSIQVKLLRVLQDRTYVRVGGEEMRRADVRVIAATNRDLDEMIHTGRFREDLYYRLNVFPIRLMPLRERRDDIPELVDTFLRQQERSLDEITPDALEHLRSYEFPGNIRELQNLIERACILAGGGKIERVHFPIGKTRLTADPAELLSLGLSLDQIEKRLIKEALERAQGNKTKAASLLGISRRALYSRMESHGIPIGGAEPEPVE